MATELEEKETSSIPKIRTFAADLKAVRKARGDVDEELQEVEKKPPKPAAKEPEPDPIPKKNAPPPDPIPKKEPEEKKDRPEPKIIDSKKHQVHSPPPFHEMERKRRPKLDIDKDDIEAAKSDERESLLADKGRTVSIGRKGKSGIDSGTVVTDTKRKRFRLFPSIIRSIADWFEDFKNKYISKKPPKYTVSGSYRKRGVISDDTVSSGITNVDHKRAVERIRKRRDEEQSDADEEESTGKQKPLLLEAPDEDEETGSATTQSPTNVATEERKSVATKRQKELAAKEAELKKREEALKAAEAEAERLREQAESEAAKSREEAAEEVERLREEAARAVEEAEARREAAAAEVSDAQMRAAAAAVLAQQGAGEPAAPEREPRSLREQLRDTNVASLLAVVGIAGIVILYVAFESLYSLVVPPPAVVPEIEVPMLVSGDQIQVPAPENNLASFVRNTIDEAPSDMVQIDIIRESIEGPVLASPEFIAGELGWQAEAAFIGSLRQVSFGGYDRSYPFIIIHSTDYETALGGMLSWENTLPQDLTLFAGTATSGDVPEAEQAFIDATISDIDVRESTAAVDNQVVWGFIDETTILITPNRFVFTEVLPFVN